MWKRADKQSEQTQNHNPAIPTTPYHTCCLEGFIRRRERKEVGGGQKGREDGRKDPTDRGQGGKRNQSALVPPTLQAVGVTFTPLRPLPTASCGSTFHKCSQIRTELT